MIKKYNKSVFINQKNFNPYYDSSEELYMENISNLEQYYNRNLKSKHIVFDSFESNITGKTINAILGEDYLKNPCFEPLVAFLSDSSDDDDLYYNIGFVKSSSLKDYFDYRDNIESCIEKQILDKLCENLTTDIAFYYPTGYDSLFNKLIISDQYIYKFYIHYYSDPDNISSLDLFNLNLFVPLYVKVFDHLINFFNEKYHFIKSELTVINIQEEQSA